MQSEPILIDSSSVVAISSQEKVNTSNNMQRDRSLGSMLGEDKLHQEEKSTQSSPYHKGWCSSFFFFIHLRKYFFAIEAHNEYSEGEIHVHDTDSNHSFSSESSSSSSSLILSSEEDEGKNEQENNAATDYSLKKSFILRPPSARDIEQVTSPLEDEDEDDWGRRRSSRLKKTNTVHYHSDDGDELESDEEQRIFTKKVRFVFLYDKMIYF